MGRITLELAAQWCGGRIDPKYKDVSFFGACNDTRTLKPGQLFLALQGQRDGHEFIRAALEKKAAAVLCTHCDGDFPAIVVPDTRIALGDIARQECKRMGVRVVAITGSVGKSTTKEMVASILGTNYRVAKTPVNHNNDIGMPMAVLEMPEDTQAAVLEMGMNHFGEIAYLSGIGRPDIGVIVNVGTMHVENLGSLEGVFKAKLEILENIKENGTIILNGDDPRMWDEERFSRFRALRFGREDTRCQVYARDIREESECIYFTVVSPKGEFPVEIPVSGEHFVQDALAAISVGLEMKVPVEDIQKSLAEFTNMEDRQKIFEEKGMTIIQDCYNAGPESMAAALAVLGNRQGRKVAVLGDMLELGVCAQAEHYKIGRVAAEKADVLLAYGPNSDRVLTGAVTGGMPLSRAKAFTDKARLLQVLCRTAKPGDVLLFKGSRGMRMEEVLEKFLKEEK